MKEILVALMKGLNDLKKMDLCSEPSMSIYTDQATVDISLLNHNEYKFTTEEGTDISFYKHRSSLTHEQVYELIKYIYHNHQIDIIDLSHQTYIPGDLKIYYESVVPDYLRGSQSTEITREARRAFDDLNDINTCLEPTLGIITEQTREFGGGDIFYFTFLKNEGQDMYRFSSEDESDHYDYRHNSILTRNKAISLIETILRNNPIKIIERFNKVPHSRKSIIYYKAINFSSNGFGYKQSILKDIKYLNNK